MRDNPKFQMILMSAALVLLILVAFEPLRYNGFVDLDDGGYITGNPHIQSGFTRESIHWAFTSGYMANWHPLTWLSHMVDIKLFGLNPLGHHLHNLLLHTLSTVLLFWLLYQMTGSVWCSAFVAVVFGIHPLHVESVVWASERKDVLSALFWMITLAAYLYYVKKGGILRYLPVMLCFTLGLMAKPMVVSLPIVLLLLDFWPLKRVQKNVGRLVVEKIPLFVLALAACITTYQVQQAGGGVQTEWVSWTSRISNALMNYVSYLIKMVWPARLGALYPYPIHPMPIWQFLVILLVLVIGTSFVISRYSKNPYLFIGWFWYGITLVPVIGLVQVGMQAMADRYMYLPSIGITILFFWTVARLSEKWPYRKVILGISSAVIIVTMTAATRAQSAYWKDSAVLFKHTLAVTHNNYTLYRNMGWLLVNQNKPDEAIDYFNKAIQIWPDFPSANLDLANLLIKRKQFDEAMSCLNRVLKIVPNYADTYVNMGIILAAQGKNDEADRAHEQAIRLDPRCFAAFTNLATLKAQQGLMDEAIQYLHQSIQINPTAEAYFNLGLILEMQGKMEEPISYYRSALTTEPNDYKVLWHLASCLHKTGNLEEAVKTYYKVLQLQPNFPEALCRVTWILATAPDNRLRNPTEAVSMAQKACQMTDFNDPTTLYPLAVAYAAANRFKEAIETAQKAFDLAKSAGQMEMAQEIEKGLKLYQAGEKPYPEPSSGDIAK
jgi:tetratricopeptide (TPR) repeat protein